MNITTISVFIIATTPVRGNFTATTATQQKRK